MIILKIFPFNYLKKSINYFMNILKGVSKRFEMKKISKLTLIIAHSSKSKKCLFSTTNFKQDS